MNSLELYQMLTRDPATSVQFGSVCALDRLPKLITRRPKLYVVNTQDSRGPGKHWLLLYFPRLGPAECFDSLGHGPKYYGWHLHCYLLRHGGDYVTNKRRYQQAGTPTCGQFCLYYAFHRCFGRPMSQILLDFENARLCENENLVKNFVRERGLISDTNRLRLG